MSRCLVAMGAFDGPGDGWVVELNAESGDVCERLRIRPPEPLRVPGKGLTGIAYLPDGRLAVSGAAAVYIATSARLDAIWSTPSFNDLHGVAVHDDRVWVVNTGLDAVDMLDLQGRFVVTHAFDPLWLTARRLGGETPARADWAALSDTRWRGAPTDFVPDTPAGDYYDTAVSDFSRRRQRDRVHPNHLAIVGDRPWVTSLAASAVIDAVDFRTVATFDAPPHDGLVRGDRVWFTRVDGVVEARSIAEPGTLLDRIDVSESVGVYGWCRGVWVTADLLWVGFTEMRRGARYPWNRAPLSATRTVVACVDRQSGRLHRLFDLSLTGRHTKVSCLVGAR